MTWYRYPDSGGSSGSYFRRGAKYLHRAIWEAANGPIPAGHHIHHKDHDTGNNDLANLELMTAAQHSARHGDGHKVSAKPGARFSVPGPKLLTDYLEHGPLTQREFAKKIRLDESLFSRARRGIYRPRLEVLVRIAKATGGAVPVEAWARNGRLS